MNEEPLKLYAGMDVSVLRYRGNDNAVLSVEENEPNDFYPFRVKYINSGGKEDLSSHKEDGRYLGSVKSKFDIIRKRK